MRWSAAYFPKLHLSFRSPAPRASARACSLAGAGWAVRVINSSSSPLLGAFFTDASICNRPAHGMGTVPHLVRRPLSVCGAGGAVKRLACPVHRLHPQRIRRWKLNMRNDHPCLNPCCHCCRIDDAKSALCNTVEMRAFSLCKLLLNLKSSAHCCTLPHAELSVIRRNDMHFGSDTVGAHVSQ